MKTKLLFFLLIFFNFFCQTKQEGFVINAITDLPEGTTVYLIELTLVKDRGDFNSKIIDSATVSDNKFSFKGKLSVEYAHMMIRTDDPSQYKYIYVQNTSMTFNSKGRSLTEASVSGSTIQDQANQYAAIDKTFEDKLDSIETLAMEAEESQRGSFITAYQNIETAQYAALANLIRKNPNYDLSSYWLMFLQNDIAEETTKELYEGLSERVKQNAYSAIVLSHIQNSLKLEIGLPAPDIILSDSSGKEVKLSAFKGKYVLIDFWASNCGPCRVENVNLAKIHNTYASKGLEILSVSIDLDESKWKKAIKKDGIFWISVWDSKRKFDRLYDVTSIPTNYLVDPNGIIIDKYLRGSLLPKKLDKLLE